MGAETMLINFGLYLIAQLKADPLLAAILTTFEAAQEALTQALSAFRAAAATVVETIAARDRQNSLLTSEVQKFGQTVRRAGGNDYGSPLYRHYFPDGTTSVTVAPISVQIVRVEQILMKLETEEDETLTAHAAPLTTSLNDLKTAIQNRDDAIIQRIRARIEINNNKRAWFDAYRKTYYLLRKHFRANPNVAEGFYRRMETYREDDVPAETPTEEPIAEQPAAPVVPAAPGTSAVPAVPPEQAPTAVAAAPAAMAAFAVGRDGDKGEGVA